jgi:RNA polymerase sigma factor (sigma-70 family)
MAGTPDDRALALRIRQGDAQAVEAFVQRFRSRIEWLAGRYGVLPEDRPDIAQDVLAAAVDQIHRDLYRGDCTLGTWIERIVHGKVVDFTRSPGRRPLPGRPFHDDEVAQFAGALSVQPTQEIVTLVHEVLLTLPRNHRIILILNKVAGFTIADISANLRWPKGTVGRVLSEAEEMFRKKICEGEELAARLRLSIGDGAK